MAVVVQLLLVGIWGTTLTLHMRRLLRLATVPATTDRTHYLRGKVQRVWWWLGRDEFWERAQVDALRCVELTMMVGLIAVTL